MQVDDRSPIAEHLIARLWEQNYFSTIPLRDIHGQPVTIISTGIKNTDAGPDFKSISVKVGDQIYQGDLEIHRAPEDWYQHSHHADPSYNQVIMHLVIGPPHFKEAAVRLDRHPVPIQVFVDLREHQFQQLAQRYHLYHFASAPLANCQLSAMSQELKLAVIDRFALHRLQDKANRFAEQRETNSWNQLLYLGLMEALGYSKNQIPFRRLAQLIPYEAIKRELDPSTPQHEPVRALGLLLGAAGLLPSQDKYFDWRKIKDRDAQAYVAQLEEVWAEYATRLGLQPMQQEEWQFFRLRPANFPTRRLAGAAFILQRLAKTGILETTLQVFRDGNNDHSHVIKQLENLFICQAEGYWANHYRVVDPGLDLIEEKTATLIGPDRARDVVINVILPILIAYAAEIEAPALAESVLNLYQNYPRFAMNSIIRAMGQKLFPTTANLNHFITTAARQQGLIHLHKLFCQRGECDRCQQHWPDKNTDIH